MASSATATHQVTTSYIAMIFIWAATPLAVVWSVASIHPMWVLISRYVLALTIMLPLLKLRQQALPMNRLALKSYSAGGLNLIGSQLFMYLAASHLSSGLMALMFGFAPLLAGLIGHLVLKTQRLKWFQWTGMVIAISGLMVVFLGQQNSGFSLLGIGLLTISLFAYVGSIFLIKAINAPIAAISQATGSIAISFVLSLLLIPFIWQHFPSQMPTTQSLIGLGFSVVGSSVIAMLCYFYLLQRLAPATIALSNVITPMVAMVLGAVLNKEHISNLAILGMCVTMSGLLLYFAHEFQQMRLSRQARA